MRLTSVAGGVYILLKGCSSAETVLKLDGQDSKIIMNSGELDEVAVTAQDLLLLKKLTPDVIEKLMLLVNPPLTQCEILMEFYDATGGPSWNKQTNWGVGDCCTNNWQTIACDENGMVTSMVMWVNNMAGSFPESFGQLTALKTLIMDRNQLSGTIPESFGQLTALYNINLSNNQLSGALPESFGKLTPHHLDLQANLFTSIPDSFINKPTGMCYLQNLPLTCPIPAMAASDCGATCTSGSL